MLFSCLGGGYGGYALAADALPLWEQAAALARTAEFGASRAERMTAAQAGMTITDQCVQKFPRQAACYYFRATLTGLYYQMHIFGYQEGLARMLKDAAQVNALDPSCAGAGGYRIIGQIYAQVPSIALGSGSIVRDLKKSRAALTKAVALAPQNIDNEISLCQTLTLLEDWSAARTACGVARQLLPQHCTEPSCAGFEAILLRCEKRLAHH